MSRGGLSSLGSWGLAALLLLVAAPEIAPSAVAQESAKPAEAMGVPMSTTTDDGVTLAGAYLAGRAGGPGVVLLHMNGRSHEDWGYLADSLQRAGFHVLAIDLRGHGKSLKQGETTLSFEGLKTSDYQAMTQDVAAAVRWLRAQQGVDGDRVSVVGASIGANLALRYGAEDPRVAKVAMLSPGLDYKGITTEDAMARYGNRPVLMAVSRDDNYAAKSVLVLDASSTSEVKEMKIFTGAGHGTRMLAREPSLETDLITWLNGSEQSAPVIGAPPTARDSDQP